MLQEMVRGLIQRILRDKILLGLIVIGILAIFMSGVNEESSREEKEHAAVAEGAMPPKEPQPEAAPPQAPPQQPQQPSYVLEPSLANDFVTWWVSGAMDYQAATCDRNHQAAFKWMTPEAQAAFRPIFWNETMSDGIRSGMLVAAFQPVSIQPQAVNPDGTVVISMKGSLVVQVSGHPATTRQVHTDFLVKKEEHGLRIAALHNSEVVQGQAPMAYGYGY
jgi:hypothetical protein